MNPLADRVPSVVLLGLDERQRAGGEHRVVTVGSEQLALLPTGIDGAARAGFAAGVEVADPAKPEPAGDVLGLCGGRRWKGGRRPGGPPVSGSRRTRRRCAARSVQCCEWAGHRRTRAFSPSTSVRLYRTSSNSRPIPPCRSTCTSAIADDPAADSAGAFSCAFAPPAPTRRTKPGPGHRTNLTRRANLASHRRLLCGWTGPQKKPILPAQSRQSCVAIHAQPAQSAVRPGSRPIGGRCFHPAQGPRPSLTPHNTTRRQTRRPQPYRPTLAGPRVMCHRDQTITMHTFHAVCGSPDIRPLYIPDSGDGSSVNRCHTIQGVERNEGSRLQGPERGQR